MMNSKFSLHFTSLRLAFLLLVLMSACQTDNLVPSEEERQHKALK